MSKSLGNVVDPLKVIEKNGSESFRLWAVIEGNITRQDLRCSEEKIAAEFKTLIKFWNVAKFVSSFKLKGQPKLTETDRLFMNEINELIEFSDKGYATYNFFEPATKLRHFLWELFASHYIELVKARAYNSEKKFTEAEQAGAVFTLHYCLQSLLKLLSPIIPLITYKLYKDIYGKNIHEEKFPKAAKPFPIKARLADLIEVTSFIWKAKKDKGLSLKTAVKSISLPKKFENLKPLLADLIAAHNASEIKFENTKEIKIRF